MTGAKIAYGQRHLFRRARMKMHALVLGVLGTMAVSGVATADNRRALESVQDAIDVVDDQGGKCRRAMFDELVAVENMLKDGSEGRANKRLRSIRVHERCPEKVDRLLRTAQDELDNAREDRRDDRRERRRDDRREDRREDREEKKAPKRPAGVPYADWHADCQSFWVIMEFARGNTSQGTLTSLSSMFAPACENATGMGDAYYPNGTMAKSGSTWYYPNGTMAKSDSTYYYPNGTMAKSGTTYYYPNGTMAKSGSTWYYANGNMSGGWEGLASQACSKNATACATYKLALNSDIEDWRTVALVKLVSTAK
jgi:hypothetical protein